MPNDGLTQLFELIARLRGPDGCPWDQKQRFEDVLSDLIEEAYELDWAGNHEGDRDVLDEMGDVLFLVCFAIAIRRETDPAFTLENIARHAHDKIYNRHPHVFGDATANNAEESLVHWENIKAREREQKQPGESALSGVAGNLPPLRHAEKVQERAASVGFDWDNVHDVMGKVREETDELDEAIRKDDDDAVAHELGDLMFSIVNIARFLRKDPDRTLNDSTAKFIRRFQTMETLIASDDRRLDGMSLAEMDEYWERAKRDLG